MMIFTIKGDNIMIKLKDLLISIGISLGVGILSSLLTLNSMDLYKDLNQPFLAPPSYLFPIVWTILFILMGISSYLIYNSNSECKNNALTIYAIQLLVNFFWPIIFFNAQMFLFSFIWLLLLWILILVMIIKFYPINKLSALLQIPYLLWVTFAGYLNFMVYMLNK